MGTGASRHTRNETLKDTSKKVLREYSFPEDKEIPLDRESTGTSGYASNACTISISSSTVNTRKTPETEVEKFKRGLQEDDQDKILNNFQYLTDELDASILCDYFIRDNIFYDNDKEDIQAEGPRHKQVDLLLRKLLRSQANVYPKFLQYLEDAGYGHVRKELEKPVFILALNPENITPEEAKLRLSKFQGVILDQLEPEPVAEIFLRYREFSIDEYEEIVAQDTRLKKSRKLLKLLLMSMHTHRGYSVLLQALRETNGLYLLKVLQENRDEDQFPKSSASNAFNVNPTNAKRIDPIKKTKTLKESEQCQLSITLKADEDIKQLEVDITKEMNEYDVKISINNDLILDKKCLITSVKKGSIIITVKGCKAGSVQRMITGGVQGPVLDILRFIFRHPNIERVLPRKRLLFEVTLKCLPPGSKAKKSNSDIIRSNLEFLVEELDALSFLKPFRERHILSNGDIQSILAATPTSRTTRTRAMIDILLEKDFADDFVDILKEKKKYIWEHVFRTDCIRSGDLTTVFAASYSTIVVNMSPNAILEQCSTILVHPDHAWSRDKLAKHILQQVLTQDSDTQLRFLHLLRLHKQIPPEIKLQSLKGMAKSKETTNATSEVAGAERSQPEPYEIFFGEFAVTFKECKGQKFSARSIRDLIRFK